MRLFAEKLFKNLTELESKFGPIQFLALGRLEDGPDTWDFLITAEQLQRADSHNIGRVVDFLHTFATPEEFRELGRIVVMPPNDGFFATLDATIRIKQASMVAIQDCQFNHIRIRDLLVITSNRQDSRQSKFDFKTSAPEIATHG